jgi:dihydroflavonol-4-reductase
MRALVTGASGFVGAAVARALLAAGWQVRTLLRAQSNRRNLQGLEVEPVLGDLGEVGSLERALDGCEALFHVAADYRLWTTDPQALYRSNVDGTRNIVEAARRCGTARIVYTSSVATIGLRADGRPSDENDVGRLEQMIGHYKRSKFLAEAWVRAGRARRHADRDRQSVHSDRSRRCETHAHRPAGTGCGHRPHAGLRRYRPEHRARR